MISMFTQIPLLARHNRPSHIKPGHLAADNNDNKNDDHNNNNNNHHHHHRPIYLDSEASRFQPRKDSILQSHERKVPPRPI